MAWDVFISHASEDKGTVAEPLVHELQQRGLNVWFDKFEITLGDSISRKINEGLAGCAYGVVILSPSFFTKTWTQVELEGLFARNVAEGKVILPVWHDITKDEIREKVPLLADRFAARWADGVSAVADQIVDVVKPTAPVPPAPSPSASGGPPGDADPITRSTLLRHLQAVDARTNWTPEVDAIYRNLRLLQVNLVGQLKEAMESGDARSELQLIYRNLLGRDPDPVGIYVYQPFLFFAGKRGRALIEQSVANSDEYMRRIGRTR